MEQLFKGIGTVFGKDFEFRCRLVNDRFDLPSPLLKDHVEDAVKLCLMEGHGRSIMSFKVAIDDEDLYYMLLPTVDLREDDTVDVTLVMVTVGSFKSLDMVKTAIFQWAGVGDVENTLSWRNPELN